MYPDHIEQLRQPNEGMQICSFLWVYYGFPTSCYEGKNVEEVRFTSGMKMGQKDESEVDCACGIPDSGVGMALGYAEGKGVPYHRAISKYTPTWPRSFTPSNQEMRSLVAKMKLIPNRAMLQGKRLVAYFSRFLFSSPSSSLIIRRVINSKAFLEAEKPTNGQA